jgi:hypothetical protein
VRPRLGSSSTPCSDAPLDGRDRDFESSNLAVVEDAASTFYGMDANAIKSDKAG